MTFPLGVFADWLVRCARVIAASITRYAASQARSTTAVSSRSRRVAAAGGGGGGAFDPSYDQTGYWLWTDLHSTIAIIAACVPALKPFLSWSAGRLVGGTTSSGGRSGGATYPSRSGGGVEESGGGSGGVFKMRMLGGGAQRGQRQSGGGERAVGGGRLGNEVTVVGGMGYRTSVMGESNESVDTEASAARIIQQVKGEWEEEEHHDGWNTRSRGSVDTSSV